MSTEETRIEGPPETWAKTPHALILDTRVGASAVRLYGLLIMYHYCHMPANVGAFAADLGVDDRSIYRWLKELRACGWITYTPNPGQKGLGERLVMHAQPMTNLSEVEAQTSDLFVRGSDKKIRASDKKIRGSDKFVRGLPISSLPDAAKPMPKSPEESGRDSGKTPPSPLPPTQPDADGGGGGGSAADASAGHQTPAEETAALLRAILVRESTIPTLTHLPPAQVTAAIAIGRTKSGVRDLASWVVSALRAIRAPDPEDAATLDRALAALPQETSGVLTPEKIAAAIATGRYRSGGDEETEESLLDQAEEARRNPPPPPEPAPPPSIPWLLQAAANLGGQPRTPTEQEFLIARFEAGDDAIAAVAALRSWRADELARLKAQDEALVAEVTQMLGGVSPSPDERRIIASRLSLSDSPEEIAAALRRKRERAATKARSN